MTDNEIMLRFMLIQDEELNECYQDMDSIHNLNTNALAIRCAGHKEARLAFMLGFRAAERSKTE